MSDTTRAELLVVGAGPVGLYAAYYAGYRGLETVVVDALPRVGGQISAFYADALIFDVPGFPSIRGADLVARLSQQALSFPVALRLGEEVIAIESRPAQDGFTLRVRQNEPANPGGDLRDYEVRAVLLATGIGRLAPQRRKEPELARWEGLGLDYHGSDLAALAGQRALVIGGAARAVDLALSLADIAAEVTLAHRRDRLLADEAALERLRRTRVRFLPFQELVDLVGESRVERAVLEDRRDGRREEIPVDRVLPCYGFSADAHLLHGFGVEVDGDAVCVDSRMASTRAGVFAAGDGATYPGKVRVLAADFGEACTAVNNIAAEIIPGAKLFPGYSSHTKGQSRRPPGRGGREQS